MNCTAKNTKNLLSVLIYVTQNGRVRASISHLLLPCDLVFNLIVFTALVRVIHEWLQAVETPKAIIRTSLLIFRRPLIVLHDHNKLIRKTPAS